MTRVCHAGRLGASEPSRKRAFANMVPAEVSVPLVSTEPFEECRGSVLGNRLVVAALKISHCVKSVSVPAERWLLQRALKQNAREARFRTRPTAASIVRLCARPRSVSFTSCAIPLAVATSAIAWRKRSGCPLASVTFRYSTMTLSSPCRAPDRRTDGGHGCMLPAQLTVFDTSAVTPRRPHRWRRR